jgi:hypothetical protein
MRVFSGRYYQNLFNLLEYLNLPAIERRFLFAFATGFSDGLSQYYFFHPSNNHRFPILCRQSSGLFALLQALWRFITVVCCYIWFSIACFWVPPRVRGEKYTSTETIGEYLTRIRLPKFFIEDYVVPLFSSVASSPHNLFLQFPAIYLTDYKRQTHMFPHKACVSMAHLQNSLVEGLTHVYNARVTKVERFGDQVQLIYQDIMSEETKEMTFDKVILAVNPKQAGNIYTPAASIMNSLPIADVSVVIHQDYEILPRGSPQLIRDYSNSELLAMQMKLDHAKNKITVATHVHPCGVLSTVWPGVKSDNSTLEKELHTSRFVRLLPTPATRDLLKSVYGEQRSDEKRWVNGSDGVYICGGWAWDGFALLEGCVWSGASTARSIGAVIPFKMVERRWH